MAGPRPVSARVHSVQDSLRVPKVDPAGVLGELSLDFIAEVDVGHLGQSCHVNEHVGEFLAEVGQSVAARVEGLADLGGEQAELRRDVRGVKAPGLLVGPGLLLHGSNVHASSRYR